MAHFKCNTHLLAVIFAQLLAEQSFVSRLGDTFVCTFQNYKFTFLKKGTRSKLQKLKPKGLGLNPFGIVYRDGRPGRRRSETWETGMRDMV